MAPVDGVLTGGEPTGWGPAGWFSTDFRCGRSCWRPLNSGTIAGTAVIGSWRAVIVCWRDTWTSTRAPNR